jgi:hypothetical protein
LALTFLLLNVLPQLAHLIWREGVNGFQHILKGHTDSFRWYTYFMREHRLEEGPPVAGVLRPAAG